MLARATNIRTVRVCCDGRVLRNGLFEEFGPPMCYVEFFSLAWRCFAALVRRVAVPINDDRSCIDLLVVSGRCFHTGENEKGCSRRDIETETNKEFLGVLGERMLDERSYQPREV